MIIKIEQQIKDLFTATFKITSDGKTLGEATFNCHLATMDGQWSIRFIDKIITMKRVRKIHCKSFRPYSISINNKECGYVYQTDYKTGFFKPRIYHHRLELNNQITDIFPMGCGEIVKSPVFSNEQQVSLVEKSLLVENDLHNFDIFSINKDGDLASVLLCLYMYSIGYYKVGEKPIQTISKGYSISKEKELLDKYNPEFKEKNFPDIN